ncbi:MAG TPA: biotin-dependent carboxyltransferase family protein [Candidatus Dormibacteraeota bacterium]|nr:biotin-dependent carboxyltransferase family protein [Candidatus Dormibacteraeota bacterium]
MPETFRVLQPGILTTIQDAGRPSAVPSGVPTGGAMDRFAYIAANLIVGNDRGAAALECTLTGPRLVALRDCVLAVTGGDLGPSVPMWTAIGLEAGDELSFAGRRSGARAYIAVAGGVIGERWLGSMSTNLMCARGGMHGRALAPGDVVSTGELPFPIDRAELGFTVDPTLRPDYSNHAVRLIPGPHFERLTEDARRELWGKTFSINPSSNRMGYRLDGPTLDAPGGEVLSFALVVGAIQLPAGGRPILLMADHQTAGGYPVIATVASASMPSAAQLAPGDELRFVETSIEDALAARAAQRAALESLTS